MNDPESLVALFFIQALFAAWMIITLRGASDDCFEEEKKDSEKEETNVDKKEEKETLPGFGY